MVNGLLIKDQQSSAFYDSCSIFESSSYLKKMLKRCSNVEEAGEEVDSISNYWYEVDSSSSI